MTDGNGAAGGTESEWKKRNGQCRKYSFVGIRAQGLSDPSYTRAKAMLEKGRPADEIYAQTGWGVGVEGRLHREISDEMMKFYPEGDVVLRRSEVFAPYRRFKRRMEQGERMNWREYWLYMRLHCLAVKEKKRKKRFLPDFIWHPLLFQYYPRLCETELVMEKLYGGRMAEYDPLTNRIRLNPYRKTGQVDSLLHEIQHAIQDMEGFSRGSSIRQWEMVKKELKERIRKTECALRIFRMVYHIPQGDWQGEEKALNQLPRREKAMQYRQLRANLHRMEGMKQKLEKRDDGWLYQHTGGEVEANEAVQRRCLSDAVRRMRKPTHYQNPELWDIQRIMRLLGEEIPSLEDILNHEKRRTGDSMVEREALFQRKKEEAVFYTEKAIQQIAEQIGCSVRFYTQSEKWGGEENGYYQEGIIFLNRRSRYALWQVFGHELTHSVEYTRSYRQMQACVFRYWRKKKKNIDRLRQQKQIAYARRGVMLLPAEVDAELIAEFLSHMLFSGQEAAEYMKWLAQKPNQGKMRQLWMKAKGIGRWFLPYEKRFLRQIRELYERAIREEKERREKVNAGNAMRWVPATEKTETARKAHEKSTCCVKETDALGVWKIRKRESAF